jgi:hypothetical protein
MSPETRSKPSVHERCPSCGKLPHRSAVRRAECFFKPAKVLALVGEGKFAVVSRREDGVKVALFPSKSQARRAMATLNESDPMAVVGIQELDLS